MENLKSNELANSSVFVSAPSLKAKNIIMIVSLALMAALGSGCSKKPDSMEKCLGEDRATSLKASLADKKAACGDSVGDYVGSKDGDLRPTLRGDAELACSSYSRELHDAVKLLESEQEVARKGKDRAQKENCAKAVNITENKAEELMRGDMAKLLNQ